MQFINRGPSLGGMWGESLGEGLGQGLQALANYKLQQVQRKQTENALAPMFGSEAAKTLSYLHGPEFGYALKYLSGGKGFGAVGQQMPGAGQFPYEQTQADYLLGRQPQQIEQPTSTPEQITSMAKKFAPAMAAANVIGGRPVSQPQAQAALQKQATMKELAGQPMVPTGTEGLKLTPELLTEKGPQNIAKVGLTTPAKKAGQLTVQEFQQLRQKPIGQQTVMPSVGQPEQIRPVPTTKTIELGQKHGGKFVEEINKKADTARENNMILDRMQQLNENVMNRYASTMLGFVSEDLRKMFSNKATQEFEKLSKQFIRGAKNIFGSRPTQFDIKALLDTVPNLSQSPEGREAVIRDCKLLNDLVLSEQKVTSDIIERNGGVIPVNIKQQVNKELAPIESEMRKQFITGTPSTEYKVGQTLNSLPKNPVVGMVLESPKGDIKWNGKSWIKV